jgi:hypothetical protein
MEHDLDPVPLSRFRNLHRMGVKRQHGDCYRLMQRKDCFRRLRIAAQIIQENG